MTIIRTQNLTKRFKELVAVDKVNLEIEAGECFGLLGPNGAGKTSLIRMVTAVSPPTEGNIWVDGNNLAVSPRKAKAILGVVPQIDNFDPDLTVLQNLITFARYFDIPRQEAYRRSLEVLRLFQLEEKQKGAIRELSGGMKRRLLLARALINQPKILILDEPTIGLDPQAKYLVWQKLKELKSQGVTQLLCTQNMEEASLLCGRVAIMHLGKIMAIDTPDKLIRTYLDDKTWEIELTDGRKEEIIETLKQHHVEFEETGNTVKVFCLNNDEILNKFHAVPRPAILEDVFFKLTGGSLTE